MTSKELIDYLLDHTKNIYFSVLDDRDTERNIKIHCVGYNSEISVSFDKIHLKDEIYLMAETINIAHSLGNKTYLRKQANEW